MSTKANKELIHEYYEAWEVGDSERLASLFSDDFTKVHHDAQGEQVIVSNAPDENELSLTEWFTGFVENFPDKTIEIHDMVAEGTVVMTRITATLRLAGEFMGLEPTGEYFDLHEFQSFKIQDGKIVEFHSVGDILDAFDQLGADVEIKQEG